MIRLTFGKINVKGEIHRPPENLSLTKDEEARYVLEGKAEYISDPPRKGVKKKCPDSKT